MWRVLIRQVEPYVLVNVVSHECDFGLVAASNFQHVAQKVLPYILSDLSPLNTDDSIGRIINWMSTVILFLLKLYLIKNGIILNAYTQ